MATKTLILILLNIVMLAFALFTFLGKFDKWYLWSLPKEEHSEVNIRRWRILTSSSIVIMLVVIALMNVLHVEKYIDLVLLALAIAAGVINAVWARKRR